MDNARTHCYLCGRNDKDLAPIPVLWIERGHYAVKFACMTCIAGEHG